MGLEKVIIREYKSEDLEKVLELVREYAKEDAEKYESKIENIMNFHQEHYLKKDSKHKIFVACKSKEIVGYIIGCSIVDHMFPDLLYKEFGISSPCFSEFYIEITFVSKPYRRQGISKKLKNKIIGYAKKHNTQIWIDVLENNYSIKVNKALGFQQKKRGKGYVFCLKL